MNGTALPYWMEVVRAIGPTAGSLLVFATAATAAIVAWKTYWQRKEADHLAYRQRKEADERAEWWRRSQWAIDYATDEREEKANIGVDALDLLSTSPLATTEDRELMESLFIGVVAVRAKRTYTGDAASDAQKTRPWWRPRQNRRGE